VPITVKSLDNKTSKIKLRSVKSYTDSEGRRTQSAIVFIPRGKEKSFLDKFEQYSNEEITKDGNFRHDKFVSSLDSFAVATLLALWTDRHELFPPPDQEVWWEVWIDGSGDSVAVEVLKALDKYELTTTDEVVAFGDRLVLLVRASGQSLAASPEFISMAAELRRPANVNVLLEDATLEEEQQWATDLLKRVRLATDSSVAVCVLDTGIFRAHSLISQSLREEDCHAVRPDWNRFDDHGHGSSLAGIALYGDLAAAIGGTHQVSIDHHLESVTLLPRPGKDNDPNLWGSTTAEAIALPEIAEPGVRRVFLMTATAESTGPYGEPTLWSASVDALAAGRSFAQTQRGLDYFSEAEEGRQRLIIISAGNADYMQALGDDYIEDRNLAVVADPAQSWNALTVGAHTDLHLIQSPNYTSYEVVGIPGDLSPHSTTSMLFGTKWPYKPDVVFEGGNIAVEPLGLVEDRCPELTILTTHHRPAESLFRAANGTSAASAGVAHMAARLMADYPDLRPESIRGLLVHSAQWTKAMEAHLPSGSGRKRSREKLLRRYGHGVPNLRRARESATSRVTLISEEALYPFEEDGSDQIHFYAPPWPAQTLEGLGEADIRMKVTLSYFVDPNPSRRSWDGDYQYSSHSLRFEASDPNEPIDTFRRRLTRAAWSEGQRKLESKDTDSSGWWYGRNRRVRGSIHSDVWEGSAVELSAMGYLAVYPVKGWREKSLANRRVPTRYSLIVTIESADLGVDLFSAVVSKLSVKERQVNRLENLGIIEVSGT
jgi:hypothetical protein